MDDEHQQFEFQVDTDTQKLISVLSFGRNMDVTVAYTADVLIEQSRTPIRNAIDVKMRTDEHGLIVEWKQPMVPGWDWLTYSRKRRF